LIVHLVEDRLTYPIDHCERDRKRYYFNFASPPFIYDPIGHYSRVCDDMGRSCDLAAQSNMAPLAPLVMTVVMNNEHHRGTDRARGAVDNIFKRRNYVILYHDDVWLKLQYGGRCISTQGHMGSQRASLLSRTSDDSCYGAELTARTGHNIHLVTGGFQFDCPGLRTLSNSAATQPINRYDPTHS